jgi:hypothetical protein
VAITLHTFSTIVYDLPNEVSRRIFARARDHHSTITYYFQLQRIVGTSAETFTVSVANVGTLTHTFSSIKPFCQDFDADIRRPSRKFCRGSGSDLPTDDHRSFKGPCSRFGHHVRWVAYEWALHTQMVASFQSCGHSSCPPGQSSWILAGLQIHAS